MLWFFLAFLLLFVGVLLLLPVDGGEEEETNPVAFYRDQLKALEADRENMDATDFEEASIELKRRLLSASRGQDNGKKLTGSGGGKVMQAAAVALIAGGSIALYAVLGSPGVDEAPAPARTQFESRVIDEQGTTIADRLSELSAEAKAGDADVDLLAEMAALYGEARNYTAAAMAYRELSYLEPENENWPLRQLEAMNVLHQGQIAPASALLLDRLVELAPSHPAVYYYRGLQYRQAGNLERAKEIWLALKENSAPDAPWMRVLNEGLAGIDPALVPELAEQQAINERAAEVANMSPEEQLEFIRGMISRLEARLEDEPENIEGWLMLAQAKAMTGDTAGARRVLQGALEKINVADLPQVQAALKALDQN